MSVKYHYFRTDDRSQPPVAALAFEMWDDDCVVAYGLSVHCPKDRFNKKLGRQIAEARMRKSPMTVNIVRETDEEGNLKRVFSEEIVREIASDILVTQPRIPRRLAKILAGDKYAKGRP